QRARLWRRRGLRLSAGGGDVDLTGEPLLCGSCAHACRSTSAHRIRAGHWTKVYVTWARAAANIGADLCKRQAALFLRPERVAIELVMALDADEELAIGARPRDAEQHVAC